MMLISHCGSWWRCWAIQHRSMFPTTKLLIGEAFWASEPPAKDKVIQIEVGDQVNSKLISRSESLSPREKQDLIYLIREYKDVFAWSYEDMPGLNPQVAMHCLNIKPDAKSVKQQQRRFHPDIMEAMKSKFTNSSNVVSFERNNNQTGLLILCPH